MIGIDVTLQKLVLLEECITEAQTLTEEWIASSCRARVYCVVLRMREKNGSVLLCPLYAEISQLVGTLLTKERSTNNSKGLPTTQWTMGCQSFPFDLKEKLVYMGFDAEVWIKEGHGIEQGSLYKINQVEGKFVWFWVQVAG